MTENPWQEEGRRAAQVLDLVSSAVVVGRDGEAAAWVALAMARAQAERRRVAVADLVGEVPPLQSLVDAESDPHGVSDSFRYGVSLNKIAHPVDASGNLFVLPSGSEAVAVEDVFRSDRWRKLAAGFREVGALLLLVAQADTPGLDALANSVDGVIVAGEATGALVEAAPPLAVVAPTRRRPARGENAAAAGAAPALDDGTKQRRTASPEIVRPPATARPWIKWAAIAAGALAAAAMLSFYLLPRRTAVHGDVPARTRVDSAHASAARANTASARTDSARADSARLDSAHAANPAAPNAAASQPLATLGVANPADSSRAVAYSVYVSAANTAQGASDALGGAAAQIPVVAMTPVLQDGAPWYRLLVGAYASRQQADSLLAALQQKGLLGPGSGRVIRTPYALLVADHVMAADAKIRVQTFVQRNVPVYVLSRGDGTVALYAGAFETPEEAAWLARALQSAGVTPTLVYRIGRSL